MSDGRFLFEQGATVVITGSTYYDSLDYYDVEDRKYNAYIGWSTNFKKWLYVNIKNVVLYDTCSKFDI